MLPRVVELELWASPGSAGTPMDGKAVALRCRRETGLPANAVLGLNFVPAQSDSIELQTAIRDGRVKVADFQEFCIRRGLPAEAGNEQASAEYLAFIYGQPLAWLHLPTSDAGSDMAKAVLRWAQANNLQVRDGSRAYEQLSAAQVLARWQSAA